MQETITVLPDKWLNTAEAAAALRKTVRTVQKMAKDGILTTKLAGDPKSPARRVYDPKDIARHAPKAPKPEPTRSHHKNETFPARIEKQAERALDTVSIVGQLLAAHKGELELLAAQFRERAKADREDVRERWEAERQERAAELARQQERGLPWLSLAQASAVTGLTRKAIKLAVGEGKIAASTAGGIRVQRASLEAFSG